MKKIDMNQLSRRSFLKVAGAAGVVGSGMVLAGCDNGTQEPAADDTADDTEEEPAGTEYEPVTVHVAFMPNLGSAATLFSAIDQGYFEEVGITVETEQFQAGPAEITAMQSGSVDISQIGHGAHSLCIQGQAKIFAFDQLSQADCVVATKSHGIETGADLAGKTVGVASGTSSEIILQYVLQDAGLTVDDINTVEMDVSGMTTALISGQIDAAATWSPNTVTLEEQLGDDYLVLGTNTDYSDEVAFPGSYVVLPEYAEENHDVLVRFGAALDKGKVYRAEHIDDVAKLLASELGVPEDTLLQSTGEGDWQGAVDAIGNTDVIVGYYEAQQKVFLDGGQIEAEVPVEDYVLTDVITESDELYETIK